MPRRRGIAVLVALAVALAGGTAWLLLRSDGTTREAGSVAPRERQRPGRGESAPKGAATAESGDVRTLNLADPDAAAPAAEGPRLELRTEVEGGFPLSDVQVLPLERDPDGSLGAWIGDDSPDPGCTDRDGSITIRYTSEPRERLFGILESREIVSAENAEPAGSVHRFKAFRAKSADPVRFVYRDPEGLVLLRPVDAATGEVLSGRRGIVARYTEQEPGAEEIDHSASLREASPGWIAGGAWSPPEVRDLRIVVPGYLPAKAPEGGWMGRVVVRMEKDAAAIRGRIVAPDGWVVEARLLRASDGSEARGLDIVGLPDRPGEFAMSGVAKGEWDLEIESRRSGLPGSDVRWVTRRFESRGSGLDLGDIEAQPGGVVRARLLSREGRPVVGAPIVLCNGWPEGIPWLTYHRGQGGWVSLSVSYGRTSPGPDPGLRKSDEEGWAEFTGLRPGATYLVGTPRVPGLTRLVEAPREPGKSVTVDLDGATPLVECVLRFTIDGDEPRFWIAAAGPFFSQDFSSGKGMIEAAIPAGKYRIVGTAVPKRQEPAAKGDEDDDGGGGVVVIDEDGAVVENRHQQYEAEVEIPAAGRFEATVDLKSRKRR
jgi:hypothetical protein